MGGLFSKPSSVKPPPVPPPPPVPDVGKEQEEETARRIRSRRGISKTIVTGPFTPTTGGKKTLLG